jgi:hypothetical protein
MNTTLEYSTRVVQEGDRRCKKSTLNDLAYLTPLRIPLMNPVIVRPYVQQASFSTPAVTLSSIKDLYTAKNIHGVSEISLHLENCSEMQTFASICTM